MTIDPAKHIIDPAHGFAVDKESGHLVGLMPPPFPSEAAEQEYPKWIVPHDSHVVRNGDHVVTPHFSQFHVNRVGGEVTVLVADADEEVKALAVKQEPKPRDPSESSSEATSPL